MKTLIIVRKKNWKRPTPRVIAVHVFKCLRLGIDWIFNGIYQVVHGLASVCISWRLLSSLHSEHVHCAPPFSITMSSIGTGYQLRTLQSRHSTRDSDTQLMFSCVLLCYCAANLFICHLCLKNVFWLIDLSIFATSNDDPTLCDRNCRFSILVNVLADTSRYHLRDYHETSKCWSVNRSRCKNG